MICCRICQFTCAMRWKKSKIAALSDAFTNPPFFFFMWLCWSGVLCFQHPWVEEGGQRRLQKMLLLTSKIHHPLATFHWPKHSYIIPHNYIEGLYIQSCCVSRRKTEVLFTNTLQLHWEGSVRKYLALWQIMALPKWGAQLSFQCLEWGVNWLLVHII